MCTPAGTESAVANGDTRTLSLYHAHTHESITATYMVDGQYDQSVLEKLNWFLRDFRRDEAIKMDPKLFDTVWEVYRESGSQQPIEVMSAYRSPETNAMLRRRSRQVAEHSQHILGRAMDQHYMDVPMSRIRELGMKLQRGGVGFYPTAGTPFVHLDVGGVRHWPRMSYDQLARLFPDGKTVHIPSNGQPLAHYEEARAELEARGDSSYPSLSQVKSKGFFAWLFGGGSDEDEDNASAGVRDGGRNARRIASASRGPVVVASDADYGSRDGGSRSFFSAQPPRATIPSQPAVRQPAPEPAHPVQVAAAPPAPAPQAPAPFFSAPVAAASAPGAPDRSPDDGMATPVVQTAPVAAEPVAAKVVAGPDPTRAPLPPRRPVELATLGELAPLPPTRPAELAAIMPHDAVRPPSPLAAKPDPIGALLATSRVANLPDVITRGSGPARPGSGMVLGYASSDADSRGMAAGTSGAGAPMPVARPVAMLSPHLDRANFRNLTRPDAIAKTAGRSALGAAMPPVRAAIRARGDLQALVPLPSTRPTSFQSRAPDLSTDRFSGPVGKAGPVGNTRASLD